MEKRKPNPVVLAAFLVGHLIFATLTWRDIAGRTDAQIKGPKTLWRIASAVNSMGSIAYWLFGRRKP